ncbi:LuxR family transcriptional regulator [Actinomycetospora sp. NBRC 106375]|uniref:ATP-binding protein n=1 Tax=Actinomycetospora sp. NBRC 106375 TaxID=3032207 RepID=UPI0024A609C9|nr:LuxR family transcriptional regulator [Actinomycetospora sp. NBRC 106375]GLZ48854.1 LuxR family transcriptional regulator [Actinomycetospora sp. NBRC 106375]
MRGGDAPPELRGRRRERDHLDRLLAGVRAGQSGVLVLRGAPGMGKTALLDHLCRHASGCRVARVAGVESEMELPFAGLHQLCAPFLDGLTRLPEPQADALGVAFGLRTGDTPDRLLVGLAVLTLLSEVAAERPLICVVDDAQWLDRASAEVLAFVARRLAAEAVLLLVAMREPSDEQYLASSPALILEGLRDDDARALLASVLTGPLDERVRERIVAEARGNPLALVELPRRVTFDELAGGFGLSGSHGVAGRIEEGFRRSVEPLSPDVRSLLLIAAAEPLGDPLLLWRAAERLGLAVSTADSPETDGLLTIGERVTFRHPLVRSAVYRAADAAERRAVHLALAEVTDRDAAPDRRAWHLAAATVGHDDDIATELERSAERARTRGGLAAAAAFLQRSSALTSDPERRAERALIAAEVSVQAGAFEATVELLATAEAGPLDELARARSGVLRAQATYLRGRGGDGPAMLLRAAGTLEPLHPRLALETYLDAWGAALYAGPLAHEVSLSQISRQALAAPRTASSPRPADLLLEGFSLAVTAGRRAAAPVLARAVAGFDSSEATVDEVLRWGWLATAAAVMVWDYDRCLAITAHEVAVARGTGALSVLASGTNVLAQAVALGGDLRRAASLAAEAGAVTEATGTRHAPYGALLVAGMRGREAEAVPLIEGTVREATAGGQGIAVQYARWSQAILGNGLGRYDEALVAAQDASEDTPELFVSTWCVSELVEAAVRCGRPDRAHDGLERLVEATEASGSDWALGMQARSRALLGAGREAESLYQEAVARLSRTGVRPELARTHLLHGEWLRREGRRADARAPLRTAHEMLGAIGMHAFADRARHELAAVGEKVSRPDVQPSDTLSAQEAEIARLAGAGHSNPEIGAHLLLSPRTVEWHLRKVFTKLGVTGRKELPAALGPAGTGHP